MVAALLLSAALAVPGAAAADSTDPLSQTALPARLTLDDAIHILRERRLDLLIADAAIASVEGDVTAAGAIQNPTITGGLYRSFFSGHLYESHLGWFSRADAQRTLELSVAQLYTQVAAGEAAVTFSREVQKSTVESDDLTKVRFRAGAISEAEAGKIHITKLEADQAVATALQGLAQAKAALAFVLGVRGPVPQFEVDPLPPSRAPTSLASASLDDLLKRAVDKRPDLKLTTAQINRARSSLRLARRLRFPDMSLNLQYEEEGSASGATVDGQLVAGIPPPTLQLSLTATLPVFYQQQGEIHKAEADVRTQLLGAGKVGAQILNDVSRSYAAFQGSRELVTRMETEMLAQVARVRDLVDLQYQKGAASLLDYLDAYRTYIATNVEYIQDLAAYWSAEHALEGAVAARLE